MCLLSTGSGVRAPPGRPNTMKTTTKTTIELSCEELKQLVRQHFGAKSTDPVYIKIGTVGDDRFGTAPQGCIGASIEMHIDSSKLIQAAKNISDV